MHARTPQDIGSLIREQRLARKLSQAKVAETIGASRQWVVDLEHGKPTLALGLVLRALMAVGLTLRVETPTETPLELPHAAIDLDAILTRARAPAVTSPPDREHPSSSPTRRRSKRS